MVLVDHSLPAEHRADTAMLNTRVCDAVVDATTGFLGHQGRLDAAVVEYDEEARWTDIRTLQVHRWAYIYGNNLHAALALARAAATHGHAIVIAHSRPTAHLESDRPFFNMPPAHQTTAATVNEIDRCATAGMRVDVVVVPPSGDPLPWDGAIVYAIRRTGGSFLQATTQDEVVESLMRLA